MWIQIIQLKEADKDVTDAVMQSDLQLPTIAAWSHITCNP